MYMYMYMYMYIYMYMYMYIYICIDLFIYLSIDIDIHIYIYLSIQTGHLWQHFRPEVRVVHVDRGAGAFGHELRVRKLRRGAPSGISPARTGSRGVVLSKRNSLSCECGHDRFPPPVLSETIDSPCECEHDTFPLRYSLWSDRLPWRRPVKGK